MKADGLTHPLPDMSASTTFVARPCAVEPDWKVEARRGQSRRETVAFFDTEDDARAYAARANAESQRLWDRVS